MSLGIVKMIGSKYSKGNIKDCLDITQIMNICKMYKNNTNSNTSVSLNDIDFSSLEFEKKIKSKNADNILESKEFKKKYAFFIKIIYACLKMDVDIFDIYKGVTVLKNNYALIKSVDIRKKGLIGNHMDTLKSQQKLSMHKINASYYETFIPEYIAKMKILDKIIESVNKLINADIIDNTDNLFTLILPYFYTYTKYIEEYNGKIDY